MYHVLSTGIAASILYLLSYSLYRLGFYNRSFHLKMWNIILVFTFILAASAGIFLALQINYKWNIPFIKTILKWHVEFGIGFAFAGVIHLIRHIPYFLRSGKETAYLQDSKSADKARTVWQNAANLFLVGFVSSSVQLLLMREMMNIAGGYELITGTFLGSWLIGSAAGSAAARRSLTNDLRKINTVFAVSPVISLVLLIILSRLLLNPGETPSFFVSIILTLIVLLPFTFVSGFTFIRILLTARQANQFSTGRSFSIETAGGVAAGIAVPVIGSGILNTYQMMLIIIILYIYYVSASFFIIGKKPVTAARIIILIVCVTLISFNADDFFRQWFLPVIKVTSTEDTPYGNITMGEYSGDKSVYYNHRLLKWQNDEAEREENIHYAMVQRDTYDNILIISGDINSNLPELLKYPVKKVWLVERDPELLKYQLDNQTAPTDFLRTVNKDAFRFIKKTSERFDAIILILPPPSTLQLNRYYTTDFFNAAKNKLTHNGIFMCSPGAGENYFNKESTILYSSVYNSLESVFKNVVPIVGNKLYYIASDGELSTSICSLITSRGISNIYVGPDFLADDLIKMKSEQMVEVLDRNVRQNTLTVPVACFHFQTYNLSKSEGERIPAYILLILVFLVPVFMIRAKDIVMFSSAGALAGFEIVLLLSLQSTAGNMYQLTGLVVAGLMTGLALGSARGYGRMDAVTVNKTSSIIVIFYIVTGLIINPLMRIEDTSVTICILIILSLVPSFFTGYLFRLLTEIPEGGDTSALVYSSDLAGSALGFIAVSAIGVPLLGMQLTLFLLSALILAALLFGTVKNK